VRASVALLALALLATPAAAGEEDGRVAQQAVDAYTRGLDAADRELRLESFRRAERLFAKLVANGARSASLYTNLGNAALQAERLGPAVLAYRRALRIDPRNPRAQQNLDHARTLLPDWVPRPEPAGLFDSFFFWHRSVPRGQRSLAGAVCFALSALLVAAGIRWRQSTLRNAAVLPAIAWIALLGSLALDPAGRAPDEAVLTADEAVARAADSALAPSAFPQPLPGGVELRVLEDRSPWLRVRLANGRDVWLNETSVTPIAATAARPGSREG
jgi:tetratricopeptide (TPR) repeat protein